MPFMRLVFLLTQTEATEFLKRQTGLAAAMDAADTERVDEVTSDSDSPVKSSRSIGQRITDALGQPHLVPSVAEGD